MLARWLRVALLLAASLLALSAGSSGPVRAAGPGPVRAAGPGGWHVRAIISVPGDSVQLNSVAAVSPSDAWAAGGVAATGSGRYRPLLVHWDGSAWQRVALPARVSVSSAPGELVVSGRSTG